jgi:cytochrome P450
MDDLRSTIPAHVPPQLIYDFDFNVEPTRTETPHWDVTKKLAAEAPPIFFTPRNGGHWVVTTAADTVEMYRNYEVFSNNPAYNYQKGSNPTRHLPLYYDPPDHTEARRIFAPLFTPGAVNKMEPSIRQLAIELIEGVRTRGHVEFISEISKVFPTTIFLQLADAPLEYRERLVDLAERYLHSPSIEEGQAGLRDLALFLKGLVDSKRVDPKDDLVSRIAKAEFLGRPLNDQESVGAAAFMFLAGLDTVASMISFVMQFLATHPAHYRQLTEDPSKIGQALEEMTRVSGVAMPERGVAKDHDHHGIPFRKGDRVVYLLQLSGMNDPGVDDPFTVDFDREVSTHLVFGSGPHRCLGSHLARLEIRVFLEEWVRRIPQFGIKPGERVAITGGTTWIPTALPLVWDPAATRAV